jgi:Transposase
MWYVGLDWADTHHDVEVQDEGGLRVGARRFAHSHDGLNELKAFLLGIAASPEELACIVAHEPRIAHHLPVGSGHPRVSGEPEERQSVAQSGRSQDRPH